MALIPAEIAFQKFLASGRNSSHFVWFLTPLEFYETFQGWIFAFHRRGKVILFPLEPLVPNPARAEAEFSAAWQEVRNAVGPGVPFFLSVYDPFLALLRKEGFQSLQVGREPYVDLAHCIPTGKSGKGVRAARNQALRAGVSVEERTGAQISSLPSLKREMSEVLEQWRGRKLFHLGGFLNTVNPFEKMEHRRYFLAMNRRGKLEGFIVATPIPAEKSFFLEDLVLREGAARGAGELLTLEAMAALAESGERYASLGVVAMTSVTRKSAHALPRKAEIALVKLPSWLSRIYNVEGLETFRKRFKPQRWENVSLALLNPPESGLSDDRAWLTAMLALLRAFQPRLNLSLRLPLRALRRLFARHPVSTVACLASIASFSFVNRFGDLPLWALQRFGFSGNSPLHQWFYRSFTSDLLFFDLPHFASCLVLEFLILRWMERSYPLRFGAIVVVATSFLDDFVNQIFLVAPYSLVHPRLFNRLVAIKDVGPSLWIALVLGLQLCSLRKHREILFAVVSIFIMLLFAFNATHHSMLVLNMNHSLFFAFGFILGKLRFEYERHVSRKVARQRPPVAKSVAGTPRRRSEDKAPRS